MDVTFSASSVGGVSTGGHAACERGISWQRRLVEQGAEGLAENRDRGVIQEVERVAIQRNDVDASRRVQRPAA